MSSNEIVSISNNDSGTSLSKAKRPRSQLIFRFGSNKTEKEGLEDQDIAVHHVTEKLGWLPVLLLLQSILAVVAFVGFITFLWFAADDNHIWRRIALEAWITKSIALASLVLRLATGVQSGIVSSMIASIALESSGIVLTKLARLSTMRASATAPHSLLKPLLSDAVHSGHTNTRKKALLCLAGALTVTTLVLQFTSALLLSDVSTGLVAGPNVFTRFSYSSIDQDGLNKWTKGTRNYPVFAEYTDATTVDSRDGVADTGMSIRALLPINDQQVRSNIRYFEGNATVIDTRVTCVRPNITDIRFDFLQDEITPVFMGNISIPLDLVGGPSSRVHSFRLGNFYCGFSDAIEGVEGVQSRQNARDWNLTLCISGSSPGYILPETVSPHSFQDAAQRMGSFLAMNYTGKGLLYDKNTSSYNFGYIFNGSRPGLVYRHRSEWLDIYREDSQYTAESAMMSFSLCFPAFWPTNLSISAFATGNHTEPKMVMDFGDTMDPSDTNYRYDGIRNQLIPSLNSTSRRGVLSLEPQKWFNHEYTSKDWLPSAFGGPANYLNLADMPSTNLMRLRESESLTIQLTRTVSVAANHTVYAAGTTSGLFLEVLQNGGTIAQAIQSMMMAIVLSVYDNYLFAERSLSDVPQSYNMTQFVAVQIPGGTGQYASKRAGATWMFMIVMATITAHCLLVAITLLWFLRATSATTLWNSWQAIAQTIHPEIVLYLSQATLAKDSEVEKCMKDDGLHRASVSVVRQRAGRAGLGLGRNKFSE